MTAEGLFCQSKVVVSPSASDRKYFYMKYDDGPFLAPKERQNNMFIGVKKGISLAKRPLVEETQRFDAPPGT